MIFTLASFAKEWLDDLHESDVKQEELAQEEGIKPNSIRPKVRHT